jgi:hypothetical protein
MPWSCPCCKKGRYCCWNKDPNAPLAEGEEAAYTSCQETPCAGMETGDRRLFNSGPYDDDAECRNNCGFFNCDNGSCNPTGPEGKYRTKQECALVCCSSQQPLRPGRFTLPVRQFASGVFDSKLTYSRAVIVFPPNLRLRFALYYWNGGNEVNSRSPYCPIQWKAYLADYNQITGELISPRVEIINILCGDLSAPCTFGGATWTSTPGCGYSGYGVKTATKPATANCIEVEVISPGGLMGWIWQAYCDENAAP